MTGHWWGVGILASIVGILASILGTLAANVLVGLVILVAIAGTVSTVVVLVKIRDLSDTTEDLGGRVANLTDRLNKIAPEDT